MNDEFADHPQVRRSGPQTRPPPRPPGRRADGRRWAAEVGQPRPERRSKKLNQVRGILLGIGILTILVNAGLTYFARDDVEREIDKEVQKAGGPANVDMAKVKQIEDENVLLVTLVNSLFIGMGVVFVVFGVIVHRFPVPVTILALVLFILGGLGTALINPVALGQGLIMKIIIIFLLAKSIQTALAYESGREARLETGDV